MAAHMPVAAVLAGSIIRQSLIPMAAFYLILMSALGVGLLRLRRYLARPGNDRTGPDSRREVPGWPGRPERPEELDPQARRGWPALVMHMARVSVPSYLLLMAVVFAYYFGVARVGGDFLVSAITGTALLIGLSMPVYAAVAWLLAHRPHHGRNRGG